MAQRRAPRAFEWGYPGSAVRTRHGRSSRAGASSLPPPRRLRSITGVSGIRPTRWSSYGRQGSGQPDCSVETEASTWTEDGARRSTGSMSPSSRRSPPHQPRSWTARFAASRGRPTTGSCGSAWPPFWRSPVEDAVAVPPSTAWRSTALSSAVVNLVLKPVADRRRPGRAGYQVPIDRRVSMPGSTSFPSGHAAAAAVFAAGVGSALPQVGIPLGAAAALVAYSRVHTGVHYPADVIAGSVAGTALAQIVHRRGGRRPATAQAGVEPFADRDVMKQSFGWGRRRCASRRWRVQRPRSEPTHAW